MTARLRLFCVIAIAALSACGDSADAPASSAQRDAGIDLVTDDQTPPIGEAQLEDWLANGSYKQWACEAEVHDSRDPSPHGFNRICSNSVIAQNAAGPDAWPKGAAGVKELYADAEGGEPIGYAVYLKVDADSAGGANWYWYERIDDDVVADGFGDSGTAKSICVGCHVAAGADADHTPTVGARDQVYTPVK